MLAFHLGVKQFFCFLRRNVSAILQATLSLNAKKLAYSKEATLSLCIKEIDALQIK
jgi:hypothetical protein